MMAKKPTYNQKKFLRANRLDPFNWLVQKDTPEFMQIIHKYRTYGNYCVNRNWRNFRFYPGRRYHYQLFQMATPGEKGSQKAGAEWGNVSIIFHLRQKRSLSR